MNASRPATETPGEDRVSRICPFCRAAVSRASALCSACGRFSKPEAETLDRPAVRLGLVEKANKELENWKSASNAIEESLRRLAVPRWQVGRGLQIAIGALLIIMALLMMRLWFGQGGGLFAGRHALALAVAGCAVLLGPRLFAKYGTLSERRPVKHEATDFSLRLFGFDANIVLAQAIAFGWMVVWAWRYEYEAAAYAAMSVVALAAILFRSSKQWIASGLGILASLFLLKWFTLSLREEVVAGAMARSHPDFLIDPAPFAWILAAIAVFPQLQLFALNGVGPGRFRGDFRVCILGTEVSIAVTTAVLGVSAWLSLESVWIAPRWLPEAIFG